jgi:hypothetical protein
MSALVPSDRRGFRAAKRGHHALDSKRALQGLADPGAALLATANIFVGLCLAARVPDRYASLTRSAHRRALIGSTQYAWTRAIAGEFLVPR